MKLIDKAHVLLTGVTTSHVEDNTDNESPDQAELPTDPNQPTTSTGTCMYHKIYIMTQMLF